MDALDVKLKLSIYEQKPFFLIILDFLQKKTFNTGFIITFQGPGAMYENCDCVDLQWSCSKSTQGDNISFKFLIKFHLLWDIL
jgi:hypothetical protein